MPLDIIMQQSRIAIATQRASQDGPNVPPGELALQGFRTISTHFGIIAALVPVTDPEMVLPDSEGLLPLEPDGPQ